MNPPTQLCPRCSKPAADGLINIQENVQGAGQVMLWSGCRKCWTVRLQADPILKIVWSAYLEKCRELEQGKRRPTRELLQLSKGAITAEIAARIVEYAQAHKKPQATVEDVIAAEEEVEKRRAKMGLVVPLTTKKDDEDEESDPNDNGTDDEG